MEASPASSAWRDLASRDIQHWGCEHAQCIGAPIFSQAQRRRDLFRPARLHDIDRDAKCTRRSFKLRSMLRAAHSRVLQHRYPLRSRDKLAQQAEALRIKLGCHEADTRKVPARPSERI